eukprot:CAMPEP_0183431258 /NCGR_PEP_ID=MMETSP0370-20130417/54700_1 /TAXON_ID=268820 /ORGANISM="Peridinium aciculiferum, Strain PAER-2" /LENGTH=136 /DNA_ID=CAMNT_0025616899 /DNA_START=120 /DNA_END=530 /DNA_ORIENTATION=-
MKSVMTAVMKKAGAMKSMKAMKAKKAMKVLKVMKGKKAKKVSKVAKGKYAKFAVFSGSKERTGGGIRQDGLVKNSRGRVVSKKMSAAGKRNYEKGLKAWCLAVKAARLALGLTGFVAIGGKTAAGKALYAKAKSLQ